MASYNRVILAGNLTRDPQLSMLPSNTPVCEFGMAINRKWRSKTGEMREDVCFVDLRAYGRQAETINQYMSKGKPLLVEGKLRYDQWEAKDGSGKRSKLYVVVDTFQFIDSRGGASASRPPAYSAQSGGNEPSVDEMPPLENEGTRNSEVPF